MSERGSTRRRFPRLRPWLLPVLLFGVALTVALVLWGKLRSEVWAFYSDGSELRAEIDDAKARPVLWQDPEPHAFEDGDGAAPGTLEAAFSADGTMMVLVYWGEDGANADLHRSDWDGRVWSKPEPIKSINTKAAERSPALSRDGRYLYFSSNREGGEGGDDLYVARWDGAAWSGVEALSKMVNTPSNELGPALSADDGRLYFSSDQRGGAEDIFVSEITMPKVKAAPEPRKQDRPKGRKAKKGAAELAKAGADSPSSLPPMPRFGLASAVRDLNSEAADVQAALTSRGDHVFLASNRAGGGGGFKIYLSRVVDGGALPPEEVDLYVEKGNVTDPAVRMEGFDLLFSVGGDSREDPNYRLFQSTTREVVGYTDMSRWEQFKELMDNIKWWILLAIAALVALIYILERWRDMTSLFHKCLAGSAVFHLLALLLAMVMLIATTIEEDEQRKDEVVEVSIDALAQEELALESIPEETNLTDTTANLESEKEESEFGAPGFNAPNEARPVPESAPSRRESVVVEAQPSMSEAFEAPVTDASEVANVLNDLAAVDLPEIEPVELEERDPSEAQPVADPAAAQFEPAEPVARAEKVEPQMTEDSAVETPPDAAQVTENQPAETLVDQPKQPEFVESTATESTPAEVDAPAETPPLESEMLTGLPDAQFEVPNDTAFEERDPASAAADEGAADPSREMFDPGEAAAMVANEPSENGGAADRAESSPTGATDVAESALDTGSSAGQPVALAESSSDVGLPAAAMTSALPDAALVDPGLPMLEEPAADIAGGPADESKEVFEPGGAAPNLATERAEGSAVADVAVSLEGVAAEVPEGGMVAGSPVAEARAVEHVQSMIEGVDAPNLDQGTLPETALVTLEIPALEEGGGAAGGPVADLSKDRFEPGDAVPSLETSRVGGGAVGDTAVAQPSAGGAIGAAPAVAAVSAPMSHGTIVSTGALPDLAVGDVSAGLETPSLLPSPSLPGDLEVPPGLGPLGMADVIRKQRGKPGIDTIEQMGGSKGSEEAVGAAMEWLSKNQEPDGRWDTRKHGAKQNFDTGGTGLALLCFYGWGERHDMECKYQKNVRSAIDWLMAQQRKDGYLGGGPGMMYSHAIAAIALCEAYGVTKDPKLKQPAEHAIAYTLSSQHPTLGGWRYTPGNGADTSVTGWQYMALHSARMAGIEVPEPAFEKARGFLAKTGGGKQGGLYGYQGRTDVSRAMVATGMFCRQLDLVPPSDPKMRESARFLKMNPMKTSKPDLYYVYYATLALYQHQGPVWTAWNDKLQETLKLIQQKNGAMAGSWDPSASMTGDGGRVVSTCLSTLSLEVYYRLLPMYGFRNSEAEAPEPKVRGE